MYDYLIKNGLSYIDGKGFQNVDLAISNGKIKAILAPDNKEIAIKIIDASGKYVIPGGVDPHVHFGIYMDWSQDFENESKFAASGGVTSVINYYRKKGSYLESIPSMIQAAEENSIIDFGLHLGILTNEHVNEIGDYVNRLGVTSYKIYTNYMGKINQIFQTEDGLNLDDGDLDFLFQLVNEKFQNVTLCVHCENMEISNSISNRKMQAEATLEYHESLSPGYSEAISVFNTLYLANKNNAKAYIVHVSSKETLELLKKSKDLIGNSVIETCPHYLAQDVNSDAGVLAKVNPPIRYNEDSEILWEGIRDGIITSYGSDNCSCTLNIKDTGIKTKPGFSGVGLNLPVLLDEGYHKRKIPLEKLIEIFSKNPAKAFNIYPQKGSISIEADADIVILDIDKEKTVRSSDLYGSSDYSIYENRTLKGWPVLTMSRGEIIYENDEIIVDKGRGKYLHRV